MPGRQHDHRWIVRHLRGHVLQRVQQTLGIIFHRANSQAFEHLREGALHHFAIFEHVRDARRATQIIFQHIELAVAIAHQIGARYVGPSAARRLAAPCRARESTCPTGAEYSGTTPSLHDLPVVVNIVDKQD